MRGFGGSARAVRICDRLDGFCSVAGVGKGGRIQGRRARSLISSTTAQEVVRLLADRADAAEDDLEEDRRCKPRSPSMLRIQSRDHAPVTQLMLALDAEEALETCGPWCRAGRLSGSGCSARSSSVDQSASQGLGSCGQVHLFEEVIAPVAVGEVDPL